MPKTNALVRLARGKRLPVPPEVAIEGGTMEGGAIVLTPETPALVRWCAWTRRQLATGDIAEVIDTAKAEKAKEPTR